MAATKYLDYNGLLYFWTLIKGMFAKPSDANPQMDGTASAGSSALYARGDHVHPSDTSKASKSSTTSAGSYGPSTDASPAHGGTFKVPYVTVNAEGIVTGVADKTITLPASGNTDTKVKQNLTGTADTTKYPLLLKYTGTATDSPSAESRYVAAATIQPSTGTIEAAKFKGVLEGAADSVANSLVLKVKTGTTEGTDLYTYNGSAGKTLDIKQGSNITLTAAAGSLTIAGTADTKNTAGSTNSTSKLFIIGATSQAANPQTYSRASAYVGTDGHLYSNSKKVFTSDDAYTKTEIDQKLAAEFAGNKGKLPWPADGPVVGRFGKHFHPVYKNLELPPNNGVDIALGKATPVNAVFNGTVSQVIVMPGYNQCVLIQHGSYFTFYCKLKSVEVKAGDKVKTGQTIGRVDTINGDTQLHFEVWKGTKPQNPEGWLK